MSSASVESRFSKLGQIVQEYEDLVQAAQTDLTQPQLERLQQHDQRKQGLKQRYKRARDGCTAAMAGMARSTLRPLERRLDDMKTRYRRVRDEYNALGIEAAIARASSAELMRGATGGAAAGAGTRAGGDVESATGRTLAEARRIQLASNQLLSDSLGLSQQVQEQLGSAITELQEQRALMDKALEYTEEIDSELSRATTLLNTFVLGLWQDWCMKVCILLLCLCVILFVVASFLGKIEIGGGSDPPPDPTSR